MKYFLLVLSLVLVQGCVARRPDPAELNYPVSQYLVCARQVTVEVIRVNGAAAPGQSVDNAITGFGKYLAGKVQIIHGEPVMLAADANGLLTLADMVKLTAGRPHRGPSDITVFVIPGLSDFDSRGFMELQPNGSHIVVIQANRICTKLSSIARTLVPPEKWSRLVIKHELCHALNVPADKSHAWSGWHCTRPDCILYPRPDRLAILSGVLHLGPPMDLCRTCRREIRQAQREAGGKLLEPDQPFDEEAWLSTVLAMNRDNPQATLIVAQRYVVAKNYKMIEVTLKPYLREHPDDYWALNCLAWTKATCGEEAIRNGSEAVELAQRACTVTQWKNGGIVDTLAAAYAENGQFDLAVKFEKQAISLAGDSPIPESRKRLEMYEAETPYREP